MARQHVLGASFENLVIDYCRMSGIEIQVIFNTKYTQQVFGDFSLVLDGKLVRVDAKAEQHERFTGNFPIELIQCADRGEAGWWYHLQQCDQIWYGQYEFGNPADPYGIWKVDLRLLRQWAESKLNHLREVEALHGYGRTILRLAPICQLISEGVAIRHTELENFDLLNNQRERDNEE